MEDGEQRHGGIEVFLSLVEVEIHDAEIDLQLGRVLLLLQELHLSFDFLLSFLALQLFLCLSGILLFFLVLLLLLLI